MEEYEATSSSFTLILTTTFQALHTTQQTFGGLAAMPTTPLMTIDSQMEMTNVKVLLSEAPTGLMEISHPEFRPPPRTDRDPVNILM